MVQMTPVYIPTGHTGDIRDGANGDAHGEDVACTKLHVRLPPGTQFDANEGNREPGEGERGLLASSLFSKYSSALAAVHQALIPTTAAAEACGGGDVPLRVPDTGEPRRYERERERVRGEREPR